MSIERVFGSKVRAAVLMCLVKASRLGLSVTPRSVARVYGTNFTETYRFMRSLVDQGLVEKTTSGFTLSEKGLEIAEFVLSLVPSPEPYSSVEFNWIRKNLPDTVYYISKPWLQTWFGLTPHLLIIDSRLQGKIKLPESFITVQAYKRTLRQSNSPPQQRVIVEFSSLRGREYKYSWDNYLSWSSLEQSYADLISYMSVWEEFLPDILLNTRLLDLDKLLSKANTRGKKRLATGLAYYAVLTGWKPVLKSPIYRLVDEKLVKKVVSITPYLLDTTITVTRNI